MSNITSLVKRIDTMLIAIEQAQENEEIPDISERIGTWAREGITRKLALIQNNCLPEDYRVQCTLIALDIESRKTPAERKAEKRLAAKYPPDSSVRDRLMQKIEQYRNTSEDIAS